MYRCDINPPPPNYEGSEWGTPSCDTRYRCGESDEIPWPEPQNGTGSMISSDKHPFELLPTFPNPGGARGPLGDMLSFMGNGKYQRDLWITPRAYNHLFNALAQPGVSQDVTN